MLKRNCFDIVNALRNVSYSFEKKVESVEDISFILPLETVIRALLLETRRGAGGKSKLWLKLPQIAPQCHHVSLFTLTEGKVPSRQIQHALNPSACAALNTKQFKTTGLMRLLATSQNNRQSGNVLTCVEEGH